jgi:hypothetical protein
MCRFQGFFQICNMLQWNVEADSVGSSHATGERRATFSKVLTCSGQRAKIRLVGEESTSLWLILFMAPTSGSFWMSTSRIHHNGLDFLKIHIQKNPDVGAKKNVSQKEVLPSNMANFRARWPNMLKNCPTLCTSEVCAWNCRLRVRELSRYADLKKDGRWVGIFISENSQIFSGHILPSLRTTQHTKWLNVAKITRTTAQTFSFRRLCVLCSCFVTFCLNENHWIYELNLCFSSCAIKATSGLLIQSSFIQNRTPNRRMRYLGNRRSRVISVCFLCCVLSQ